MFSQKEIWLELEKQQVEIVLSHGLWCLSLWNTSTKWLSRGGFPCCVTSKSSSATSHHPLLPVESGSLLETPIEMGCGIITHIPPTKYPKMDPKHANSMAFVFFAMTCHSWFCPPPGRWLSCHTAKFAFRVADIHWTWATG